MNTQIIQEVLQDIHYPITKDELIEEAKKRAPEILPMIQEHLPQQTFHNAEEIMSKLPLGNMKNMLGM